MDERAAAAALRQIGRGFMALAESLDQAHRESERDREAALLREWAGRGLTQAEASGLFRKHGYAPQTAGGWVRGHWIEVRPDGLRYLTEASRQWLSEQPEADR